MADILLGSTASNLVNALVTNLHAHVPLYSRLPGAILCDEPELLALLCDLDPSESNVYRADYSPEQASEKIEQVLQRYRSQGCLPMFWQVGSSTRPTDLGKYLEAQGFSHVARVPGMAIALQDLARQPAWPGHLVVERVSNSTQLMQWTEIVADADRLSESLKRGFYQMFGSKGFGSETPWLLFMGTVNGQPVATSRLFCAGGVAGIYHVATVPQARGHGFGTAMTLAAAHAGRGLGYRVGVLYASPAGYGVYRRLGFQECCHIDVYKSPE
jgi:GNAT superfamily N-acetyltransferase